MFGVVTCLTDLDIPESTEMTEQIDWWALLVGTKSRASRI